MRPLVSISCITYNHAPYIKQCLDGFMMQQTNFSFEVLIHDDASTDGTEEIIRAYEKEYPEIIKPLYETENQWVKGKAGSAVFNFPRAQGRYIAMCEGDDYWTDPLKLQKQVDALEQNTTVDLCFHPALILLPSGRFLKKIGNHSNLKEHYNLRDQVEKGGGFMPTASLLIRRSAIETLPSFFFSAPVADYFLQSIASIRGGSLFLPEPMSVYRRFSNGSWSNSQKSLAAERKFIESMLVSLDEFLLYLGEEYTEAVRTYKSYFLFVETKTVLPIDQHYFKQIIEKSWEYKQKISTTQSIFYKLRNHPQILKAFFSLYAIIKYPKEYAFNLRSKK